MRRELNVNMPSQEELVERVEEIADRDGRYRREAYFFVFEALAYTVKQLRLTGRQRHVSGGQLLDGIREYGLDQYGPTTKSVFAHWGVHTTRDFGEIVFLLVESSLMGKTDEDSIEDFVNVYDFDQVFDWRKAMGRNIRSEEH